MTQPKPYLFQVIFEKGVLARRLGNAPWRDTVRHKN